MGFTKTKEELDAYYALGVRKFIGAKMLGVMFETKPEIVERLLPPPLQPADAPNGLIFIAEYPETNLGPGYREAALFIRCQYEGEGGSYCLSMPIMSEENRLYNGRDIFGFPKKMAHIELEKNGKRVRGSVERNGIKFIDLSVELTGSLPELPGMGPNFLFKASPRIDLKPGFDGPVLLCRHMTEIEMKELEIGQADLKLTDSEFDPWAELEPKPLMGFFMTSDNTMMPGSVIKEVDGDAFLPYYFKITDFYAGE